MSSQISNIGASAFDRMFISRDEFEKDIPNSVHKGIASSLQSGIDRLIGDMLTIVEMMGLPERQENAIKSQMKKAFYERYRTTADNLIDIPFALMEVLTPNQCNSLTAYGPGGQNQQITGNHAEVLG